MRGQESQWRQSSQDLGLRKVLSESLQRVLVARRRKLTAQKQTLKLLGRPLNELDRVRVVELDWTLEQLVSGNPLEKSDSLMIVALCLGGATLLGLLAMLLLLDGSERVGSVEVAKTEVTAW